MKNLFKAIATVAFLFVAMIGVSKNASGTDGSVATRTGKCIGDNLVCYGVPTTSPTNGSKVCRIIPGEYENPIGGGSWLIDEIPDVPYGQIVEEDYFLFNTGSSIVGYGVINGCMHRDTITNDHTIYKVPGEITFTEFDTWEQAL